MCECLRQADAKVLASTPSDSFCSSCGFEGLESEVLVHAMASHLEPNLFSAALVRRFITIEVCSKS